MRIHCPRIQWARVFYCLPVAMGAVLLATAAARGSAHNSRFTPPTGSKNVTISNGGLAVTFDISWGAVVIGIANKNLADGLNIVDAANVGRELQVDQFLFLKIGGCQELMINPTQAGAAGYQGYYQHPKGIVFPEKGSSVVRWSAKGDHFHAVIKPWDYDTGKPTKWAYVEDVHVNSKGVARFHYTFYNHESKTYIMNTEVPTLYSDRTDAFMYPLTCPYTQPHATRHHGQIAKWPVRVVTGSPTWPPLAITSNGWIANIDIGNSLGIFYTTPVGLSETCETFPGVPVSGKPPLGKTNVSADGLISYPGEIYSIEFSVLVSTPRKGPALISRQPPAVLKIIRNVPPKTGYQQ